MEITYDKDYLSDLYHKGKTDDNKHRFQLQIIKNIFQPFMERLAVIRKLTAVL